MTANQYDTWDDRPTRMRVGMWLLAALVVAGAAGAGWYAWRCVHALDGVVASAGWLTLAADQKENLHVIDRQGAPELWYRATLDDVPAGAVVPLTCAWIDPHGTTYHRNRYETQPVAHQAWETHARCQIRPDAPLGAWRVQLILQGRVLHSLTFEVRDGDGKQ